MLRAEPRTDAFESFTFCGLPVVSDEANQLLTNHVGGPSFKHFLHATSEFSRDHADFNATAGTTHPRITLSNGGRSSTRRHGGGPVRRFPRGPSSWASPQSIGGGPGS